MKKTTKQEMIMYSDEDRQMHVAAWKQSGMTQSDYAQMHGMSAKTLSNWCRDQRYQQSEGFTNQRISKSLYQESDRQEHVRRWQASGMTAAAYSDMVGVNRNTFHTWLRTYGLRSAEVLINSPSASSMKPSEITAVPTGTVKELQVPSSSESRGIRIRTAEGLQIEIMTKESVGIAVELMRQWEEISCG